MDFIWQVNISYSGLGSKCCIMQICLKESLKIY